MKYLLAFAMLIALALPADAQWRRGGRGLGGAVIGGVIGGIIGGAIRQPSIYQPQPVYYYTPQQQMCMQRYRSYNVQTGFFFGFDGQYHRCS